MLAVVLATNLVVLMDNLLVVATVSPMAVYLAANLVERLAHHLALQRVVLKDAMMVVLKVAMMVGEWVVLSGHRLVAWMAEWLVVWMAILMVERSAARKAVNWDEQMAEM